MMTLPSSSAIVMHERERKDEAIQLSLRAILDCSSRSPAMTDVASCSELFKDIP